jgi:hypothetical protein
VTKDTIVTGVPASDVDSQHWPPLSRAAGARGRSGTAENRRHAVRRRHIGVVTETYPPEINGVAVTVARLVDGLRSYGHTVSVIHPHQYTFGCRGCNRDPRVTVVRGAPLPGHTGLHIGLPAEPRLATLQRPVAFDRRAEDTAHAGGVFQRPRVSIGLPWGRTLGHGTSSIGYA